MKKFELNPHWKSDLAERLAGLMLVGMIVIGLLFGLPALTHVVRSIAACPIHITTDRSDYCMSVGIGR